MSDGRVDFGTGESSADLELGGFGVPVADKRKIFLESPEQIANMMVLDPYPGYESEKFSLPSFSYQAILSSWTDALRTSRSPSPSTSATNTPVANPAVVLIVCLVKFSLPSWTLKSKLS